VDSAADESPDSTNPDIGPECGVGRRLRQWRERETIAQITRRLTAPREAWLASDAAMNDATRLPDGESVDLAAIVVAEAFTPSTISSLYGALTTLQTRSTSLEPPDWVGDVKRRRADPGGDGFHQLPAMRRPGAFLFGGAITDPDLPTGVDTLHLTLWFPMPSLTILIATFAMSDDAVDLNTILRADYRSTVTHLRLKLTGRLGILRARVPWARPAPLSFGYSRRDRRPDEIKRHTFDQAVRAKEQACSAWLVDTFPGRFASAPADQRPVLDLLITREAEPFTNRIPYLSAAGLSFSFNVWRSGPPPVWRIGFLDREPRAVAAARRREIVMPNDDSADDAPVARIANVFDDTQAPIVGVWATTALLAVYERSLASIRDLASTRHRSNRPVKQALDLDGHLTSDGFDIAAVTADIAEVTNHQTLTFGVSAPPYEIQTDHWPKQMQPAAPLPGAIAAQRRQLAATAARLARDSERTVAGVAASAGLRQTVSNTRLQRWVVLLAILTLVVAIIGLERSSDSRIDRRPAHPTSTSSSRSGSEPTSSPTTRPSSITARP
jgi:hypothetical protein